MLDCCLPCRRVKRKFRHSPTFRHGRQLEKVTGNDKLNTAEWPSVVSDVSRNLLQLIEQISIDHGHLVDNENPGAHPAMLSLLVLLDPLHELWHALFTQADSSETVQGHAANVASGKASGRSDGDAIGFFAVFLFDSRDDLTHEHRFSRSC